MKTRTTIYAERGKVLTDGKIYGTAIHLAEGRSTDGFYEISAEEYARIMKSIADEMGGNGGNDEQ